mgnify:CR=1 FL=1
MAITKIHAIKSTLGKALGTSIETQTRPTVRCWYQAIIVSLKQLLSTLK